MLGICSCKGCLRKVEGFVVDTTDNVTGMCDKHIEQLSNKLVLLGVHKEQKERIRIAWETKINNLRTQYTV